MRIIGGNYRGRALLGPKTNFVRPTTDKVKEAVFNILGDINDKRFLDLFGGAGGMGIEAISRGARATFVDSLRDSYKLIKSNLANVGMEADVMYADYLTALRRAGEENKQFDYIYIDPPYQTDYDKRALAAIAETGVLAKYGTVIVEHSGKEDLTDGDAVWEECDNRRYGSVYLTFFRKKETP